MKFFSFILKYARIFTLLVVVLPLVAGVAAYQSLPREGQPEILIPIAFVTTPYIGASPNEVESLVTNPLEESLSGISEIKDLSSFSAPGVSIIVVEFDVESDMEQMLQKVREKVSKARKSLPDEILEPEVAELSFAEIPIMLISVVGDLDPITLKKIAENAADQLRMMPEVLDTDVTGGLSREIHVYLDPDRLRQYGLTILEVAGAISQADVSIPGGNVTISGRKYGVRTFTEIKQVEEYLRVPLIERGDKVVFLGDVAQVVDGHEEDISYSRVQGKSSVSIAVKKRSGANILEAAEKIRNRIKELEKTFPQGVTAVVTGDQSKFIKQGFSAMTNSALSGLVVVILVLFFAMGLRNSIITSFSIPLTLLTTFILLKIFGLTNNDMVRFSLVLCIGLLVDNSIIVVESSYYHFQLGKTRMQAVIDGTSEIAMPVISATLTTISAFLPMLLMSGVMGKFMGFMPKTVAITLFSSLIVALISNPLILSRFMKRTVVKGKIRRPEEDLKYLKKLYVRFVTAALNHRVLVVFFVILGLLTVGGLFGAKIIKTELFPQGDFDFIYVTIDTPPGTEVDITNEIAKKVEAIVSEHVPEAIRVVSTVGFQGQSAFQINFGGTRSNYAEVTLELMDSKEFARASHLEIRKRLRPMLDPIPGAQINFRSIRFGPPTGAPIEMKVFGHDLEVLKEITAYIKSSLQSIRGAVEVKDDFSNAAPEIRIDVDREKAAALGVPLVSISQTLRAATAGLKIKEFRDETDVSKKYDLSVRFAPEHRKSLAFLDKIQVRSRSGRLVPLSNLATVTQGPGVNLLRHIDRQRVVKITAQNLDRSAIEITNDLQKKVEEYNMPPGYKTTFGGDVMEMQESFASLRLAYIVSFILILTILVAQFNSFFQPFAIMAALPLSVVGAVAGLLITGNNFSLMSFIGLVGLTGIVVNDSIILVDRINHLRLAGMPVFESIILAGQQRLRPIISTTLTTIGGLFTLTITDQMWEGLGVVIIFGIAFATVLTLVVVPVMYTLLDGLGYHMASAIRGPRRFDKPEHQAFYYSRTAWARTTFFVIIIAQAAVLLGSSKFVVPMFLDEMAMAVFQAPTLLKTALEVFVFVISLGLKVGGFFLVVLLPTWIGLIWLHWLKNMEGYFIELAPDSLILTSPVEKITIPAVDIKKVKYSVVSNCLYIKAGPRLIKIKKILSRDDLPEIPRLLAWLFKTKHPERKMLAESMQLLRRELERLQVGSSMKTEEVGAE